MTSRSNAGTLPRGTRIGRTALRVTDLEAVTGFYRDVVGLEVCRESDAASVLGADETPLLVLEEGGGAPERRPSSAGLYHNAFRVPSREALGDALARIRDDWRLDGAADHWVSEALYLTDPEGNGVEIYRDFPRDEWPAADDGSVRMGTEALDLDDVEAAGAGAARVPPETDVGHVHLEVSSLEAFEDCYVDAVGFEVQTPLPAASFVSAGGYHHHLGANTWNRRTGPAGGRGLSWFEVVLPERRALDGIRDRLTGSRFSAVELDDGLSVADPDGIEVRFRVEP